MKDYEFKQMKLGPITVLAGRTVNITKFAEKGCVMRMILVCSAEELEYHLLFDNEKWEINVKDLSTYGIEVGHQPCARITKATGGVYAVLVSAGQLEYQESFEIRAKNSGTSDITINEIDILKKVIYQWTKAAS